MNSIQIIGFSGMTAPISIEVCNIFEEACSAIYQTSIIPPQVTILLPDSFYFATVGVLKIIDAKGCSVTKVLSCNTYDCDITYIIS